MCGNHPDAANFAWVLADTLRERARQALPRRRCERLQARVEAGDRWLQPHSFAAARRRVRVVFDHLPRARAVEQTVEAPIQARPTPRMAGLLTREFDRRPRP